jgi:hypothetical protein
MGYPNIPINDIVSGYKDAMDFLANATSRNITVFVEPSKSGCQNHLGFDPVTKNALNVYNSGNPFSQTVPTVIPSFGISGIINVPFSGGNVCPVCDGRGFIYSPASGVVNARIQWRNKDSQFEFNGTKIKSTDFSVRIKVTGNYATDLLDRAIQVSVDGQNCVVIEEKVPVGLRDIHTFYYFLKDIQ